MMAIQCLWLKSQFLLRFLVHYFRTGILNPGAHQNHLWEPRQLCFQRKLQSWRCSSLTEYLPSVCEAPGLYPPTLQKIKNKERKVCEAPGLYPTLQKIKKKKKMLTDHCDSSLNWESLAKKRPPSLHIIP